MTNQRLAGQESYTKTLCHHVAINLFESNQILQIHIYKLLITKYKRTSSNSSRNLTGTSNVTANDSKNSVAKLRIPTRNSGPSIYKIAFDGQKKIRNDVKLRRILEFFETLCVQNFHWSLGPDTRYSRSFDDFFQSFNSFFQQSFNVFFVIPIFFPFFVQLQGFFPSSEGLLKRFGVSFLI